MLDDRIAVWPFHLLVMIGKCGYSVIAGTVSGAFAFWADQSGMLLAVPNLLG